MCPGAKAGLGSSFPAYPSRVRSQSPKQTNKPRGTLRNPAKDHAGANAPTSPLSSNLDAASSLGSSLLPPPAPAAVDAGTSSPDGGLVVDKAAENLLTAQLGLAKLTPLPQHAPYDSVEALRAMMLGCGRAASQQKRSLAGRFRATELELRAIKQLLDAKEKECAEILDRLRFGDMEGLLRQ